MNRLSFINFLQGLLNLNPIERWSPHQAKLHPFITGEPFLGNFIPPTIPKKPQTAENSANLEPTLPGRSLKSRSASLSASSSTSALSGTSSGSHKTLLDAQVPTAPAPQQTQESATSAHSSSQKETTALSSVGNEEKEAGGRHGLGLLSAEETKVTAAEGSAGASSPSGSSAREATMPTTATTASAPASAGKNAVGDEVTDATSNSDPRPTARFAEDPVKSNDTEDDSGVQTTAALPMSSSLGQHHQNRPRATTMGTVDVPKNMVQLAAAITPQEQLRQHGLPNSSHRSSTMDMHLPPQSYFGSPNVSHGGSLRQIPERSEQNSPVLDSPSGEQIASTTASTLLPTETHQHSTYHQQRQSHQYHPQEQQQQQQQHQQYRYLLRSGSDSTGKVLSHRRASAGVASSSNIRNHGVGGYGLSTSGSSSGDAYRRQESGTSSTSSAAAHASSSSTLAATATAAGSGSGPETTLTPLQRMQQQLVMGQSQNKQQQQQQQQRYHFGYPQSNSSLSESGFDSNNSSRLDEEDEEDEGDDRDDGDRDGNEGDDSNNDSGDEGGEGITEQFKGDKGKRLAEKDFAEGERQFSRLDLAKGDDQAVDDLTTATTTAETTIRTRDVVETDEHWRSMSNNSLANSATRSQSGSSATGTSSLYSRSYSSSSMSRSGDNDSPYPALMATGMSGGDGGVGGLGRVRAEEEEEHDAVLIAHDAVNDGDDEDSSRDIAGTVASSTRREQMGARTAEVLLSREPSVTRTEGQVNHGIEEEEAVVSGIASAHCSTPGAGTGTAGSRTGSSWTEPTWSGSGIQDI
ncbi:dual specificity protein kinase yak1 [Podila epigama]|nr:dual specificity protein kinase yak1 [Podila epigama]